MIDGLGRFLLVVLHDAAVQANMNIRKKIKIHKVSASFVSIINLLRTFRIEKSYRLTSSPRERVVAVHLTLPRSLALKRTRARVSEERSDEFSLRRDSLSSCWKSQQKRIKNVRIVEPLRFTSLRRRKYNEHRPTFCRFSNLFLAKKRSLWRILFTFFFNFFMYRTAALQLHTLNSPHQTSLARSTKELKNNFVSSFFFSSHFLIYLSEHTLYIFSFNLFSISHRTGLTGERLFDLTDQQQQESGDIARRKSLIKV